MPGPHPVTALLTVFCVSWLAIMITGSRHQHQSSIVININRVIIWIVSYEPRHRCRCQASHERHCMPWVMSARWCGCASCSIWLWRHCEPQLLVIKISRATVGPRPTSHTSLPHEAAAATLWCSARRRRGISCYQLSYLLSDPTQSMLAHLQPTNLQINGIHFLPQRCV